MSVFEHASDLNLAVVQFLYTFSSNLIIYPHALVLDLFVWLSVFSDTMEMTILESACVNAPIFKSFLALSVRKIILKLAGIY